MLPKQTSANIKQWLEQRLCFGQPPQIIVLPGPIRVATSATGEPIKDINGAPMHQMEFSLQNARPIVHVNEPPCSLYERKSYGEQIIEVDQDSVPAEAKQ
jgi:hypothetical protein